MAGGGLISTKVRLRGCLSAFVAGVLVGLVAAAALSVVTAEGSVVRGVLVSVAVAALPLACAVAAYRQPPLIERRTRRRLLLLGGAITLIGIVGFMIVGGLILVGIAVVAVAVTLPTRPRLGGEAGAVPN